MQPDDRRSARLMARSGGSSGPDSVSMIHLGTQTSRDAAGFTVKHCVLCLTNRLHLVEVSSSEFAGFTYATKAFLLCTRCGLEREVAGDAATSLVRSAVSRDAIVETLDPDFVEGEFGEDRPAGTEWINPEFVSRLAA